MTIFKFTFKRIDKLLVALVVLYILIIPGYNIVAQTVDAREINGEIQLLSEEQLNAFWTNAKKRGYTLRTVPALLGGSGYSFEESARIVERLKILEQQQIGNDYTGDLTSFEQKIFGLQLFENSFNFSSFNYLPTPGNYQLGVGDVLGIVLYGETDANYTLAIDKEGKVRLPFIGPFSLIGLSLDAAKSLIKQKLVQVHAGLGGANPNVYMDLTLTNARSLTVSVLGEVESPGYYSIPSTSNIFGVLYSAGGPTSNGTLRNIRVFRANKLIKEVDLYDFINKGYIDESFVFKDQDVIILPTYESRVELAGAVKNPGIYEIKSEESLSDLVSLAGGFEPGADTSTFVLKRLLGNSQFAKSIDSSFNLEELSNGDIIEFIKSQDYVLDRVQVTGAVKKPGVLSFETGMTLQDVLDQAGGLREDAAQQRVTIFQVESDLDHVLKSINTNNVDPSSILITERSLVFVPSRIIIAELGTISIDGAVKRKGELPYYEDMSLLDALVLSDGIEASAFGGNVEIARVKSTAQLLGNDFINIPIPQTIEDFGVMDDYQLKVGDRITIRNNPNRGVKNTVFIRGEILQSGEYVIDPGITRVSDVVQRAGSYLKTANLNGLKLYRRVQTLDEESDSSIYERKESVVDFINDPRFDGSVSKLQFDATNSSFNKLEKERELAIRQFGRGYGSSQDSISVLNNFKLSKSFVVDGKVTELLEIGLSYEEIIENPNSIYNVTLLEGDILYLPPMSSLIEIVGNVFRPTQAIYREDKTFLDYVETAGGFKRRSDKKRAYIEYSNGEVKRVRGFLFFKTYPKVEMDSRILIPSKPPVQPLNFDRIVALITTTISTYLLIEAVSRRN